MADSITPWQVRAARAMLNWTREELAEHSKLSITTIYHIEKETYGVSTYVAERLKAVFAKNNVRFTGLAGVEFYRSKIRILENDDGFKDFCDELRQEIKSSRGELKIRGVDQEVFTKYLSLKDNKEYVSLLRELKDLTKIQMIIREDALPYNLLDCAEYRAVTSSEWHVTPIYVYAQKVATILWEPMKVIVIDDEQVAQAYRKEFNLLWEKVAKPL
jgi:DNA-binding XRE family transcriptional regulator